MYDIDLTNIKKSNKIFMIFLIVGIIFLIILIGILVGSIMKEKSLDSKTTSTFVEVKSSIDDEGTTMYSPIYHYEVNGQNYECSSSYSSSTNPGTDNRTVYYDSKDPSKCMTEYSKSGRWFLVLMMILPIICIMIPVLNMIKTKKRIQQIKELNEKGKLVKKLPYRMEGTGLSINGVQILRPVVDYVLPNGTTIELKGDARHDRKSADQDGMVDLIIDESDPNNYFIDFEINRLTGNLPQDYNQQNNQENIYNPYAQQ